MSERMHWVFFEACGCPLGVLDQTAAATRSKAWREFFETARERNGANDRGVTVESMNHDQYVADVMPKLFSAYVCPHQTAGAGS